MPRVQSQPVTMGMLRGAGQVAPGSNTPTRQRLLEVHRNLGTEEGAPGTQNGPDPRCTPHTQTRALTALKTWMVPALVTTDSRRGKPRL